MRVLVLGASGMLGNAVFRTFAAAGTWETFGAVRSARSAAILAAHAPGSGGEIVAGGDVADVDSLAKLFAEVQPDLVVNCIGLVKQLADANDPLLALPLNALLPHRLARLCAVAAARFIHVSTDCVFSGSRGGYREDDAPDATDLYGRSKLLGEVDYPNAITLRTSIIGHELDSAHGLVGWFLAQEGCVQGYAKAIFSGLPTVELARVMRDIVAPRPELRGLYHVASAPIAKLDLLRLVATAYGKDIDIEPSDRLVIDRSLNAGRFNTATGYEPPAWPALIAAMRDFG